MSFPKLMLSATRVALYFTIAATTFATLSSSSPARAEPNDAPPVKLALVAPPAPRKVALVDAPRSGLDKAPAKSTGAGSTWWPWAVAAAGAAGVAAVIFLASGRDPACPSGRVCQ